MRYDTVETSLRSDIKKIFDNKEEDIVAYITGSPVEDYPARVGYLQAVRELRKEVETALAAYFPG